MRAKATKQTQPHTPASTIRQARTSASQHTLAGRLDNPLQAPAWQPDYSAASNTNTIAQHHNGAANFSFANIPVLSPHHAVQAKLSIGQANDKYEQEADRVAHQVMGMPDHGGVYPGQAGNNLIQRTCDSCANEYTAAAQQDRPVEDGNLCPACRLQTKPLADQITPLVQRQEQEEEEEEETPQAKLMLQRQGEEKEEEEETPQAKLKLQQQGEEEEEKEETPQAKLMLQRQGEEEEEKEETPQAKLMLQRQGEEEEKEEEEEHLNLKASAAANPSPAASPGLATGINALRGGGQPLSPALRGFMEPRFGRDFKQVRIHTGNHAAGLAKQIHARAFTVGHNIAFGAGQYQPNSTGGKRLLAHELTHVVQQKGNRAKLQRKIIIGGTDYTPTAKYYQYLKTNFGDDMVEFIKTMHNSGNPPNFTFASKEQMGREVRIRHQAIKGIHEVHKGCCNYPDSAHPDYLDNRFWNRVGWMHFVPKSPLPPGTDAADAIEAIFAPGAKTRLECMSMTVAVEYYSLLKGLGEAKFNAKFPAGAGLEISTRLSSGTHPTFYGATKKYKNLTLSSKSELLPGDWVYFQNFADYPTKHPGGAWRGENAIYLGGGKYRGFGVPSKTEAEMNAELVRVYNLGLPTADKKDVPALLSEGGGLQLSPVFRPDIAKLAP